MTTERRWLKSVIAAAAQTQPALPWERAARTQAPQPATQRPTACAAQ